MEVLAAPDLVSRSSWKYKVMNDSDNYFLSQSYQCWNCRRMVLGRQLYKYNIDKKQEFALLQCPSCKHPVIQSRVTYRRQKAFKFMPDTYVQHIENIPYELLQDYREAHGSYDNRHYKSCEMICRNILQGIAVDKGSEAGKSFVFYINYLVGQRCDSMCSDNCRPCLNRSKNTSALVNNVCLPYYCRSHGC